MSDLQQDVRRFVGQRIESLEELEVLVVLQRKPLRFWSAAGVAQRLHLSESAVSDALERLARVGLLDVRIGSDVVYRFSPATPAIARIAAHVADTYGRNRFALLALLTPRNDG